MDYIVPLALGFAVIILFIALRYHQAYRRRIELQRKRRHQGRTENTVAQPLQ
jgi:hypothetical protein